jgi:hypothetical protein
MVSSLPQISPTHLLASGRRAESEHHYDYAARFYRHLVDHFPGSAEAKIAQDALQRIAGLAKPPQLPALPVPHAGWDGGSNGKDRARSESQAQSAAAAPAKRVVVKRARYRLGRIAATLTTIIGFVCGVAGIVTTIMAIAAMRGGGNSALGSFAELPPTAAIGGGVGMMLAGLLLILFGQIGRAVMGAAAATRALVAFERARVIEARDGAREPR